MKRYLLFLFVLIILFSWSCKKEKTILTEARTTISLLDVYYNLVANPEIDATFSIHNYQANFGYRPEDEVNNIAVSCVTGKSICDYEHIDLNGTLFQISDGYNEYPNNINYKSFFGQNASFRLTDSSKPDLRNGELSQIYIPAALDISITEVPSLSDGYQIVWNEDVQNVSGVFIVVEYYPFENPNFSEDYPDEIIHYINIEDDGSYSFNVSDFPGIPTNAIVTLKILRGAFDLGESEEDAIRIFALSHVTGYARF